MLIVRSGLATRASVLRLAELAWPTRYDLRRSLYVYGLDLDIKLTDLQREDVLAVVEFLTVRCPPLLREMLRQAHEDLARDVDDCFALVDDLGVERGLEDV